MKKILISLAIVGAVGAVVAGATGAFFSDTETSTGNTFTAGSIDLKIDNTSYLNGEFNKDTSWLQPKDLEEGDFFFSFSDLKPGDFGEDTISIRVDNNPAYACVDVRLDSNKDNGCTDPEKNDANDLTCGDPGETQGELASHVRFIWWVDDGDNVLEKEENLLPAGPLAPTLAVGDVATVALAEPGGRGVFGGALPGAETVYLGKAWCFGTFNLSPLDQDGPVKFDAATGLPTNGPDSRSAGFTCDGTNESNITQSDSFEATISFIAEQTRNNDGFRCSSHLKSPGG